MKKEDLKIVFFGTPEFAVESLRRLYDGGFNIVSVVTMPDKPAGRGHHLYQSPVKEFALKKNIPVLQPVKLKDSEFISQLQALSADLFIVIAFRMLPEAVWKMPPLGTFNLHASLLPKYRGAAPINWAVINGETTTGVTTFFLKHEIDTGDIIDRQEIEIFPSDNAGSVHDKLMKLGAELTVKTVNSILNEDVKTVPQNEIAGDITPTPAPKIFKDTCHIDWNQSALSIHNLVRGLSPYPAAWSDLLFDDESSLSIKILETELTDIPSTSPGRVNIDFGKFLVDCGDRSIRILSLQPQGKKRMTASDYLRGLRTAPVRFE